MSYESLVISYESLVISYELLVKWIIDGIWQGRQRPIGTIIIFRQCVSHIFYKKAIRYYQKPLFCDIPQIWFFSFFN